MNNMAERTTKHCKNTARFALGLAYLLTSIYSNAQPSDIDRARQLHENFWGSVVNSYPAKYRTQANSREEILTEIEIFKGRKKIEGKTTLFVTANIAPHYKDFSYLEISGENLDRIASIGYKTEGGFVYTNALKQTPTRMQIPGSLYDDWNPQKQIIVIDGDALITDLRLVSLEGITSSFDESLFIIKESTTPPLEASLIIDPSVELSIDGVQNLPTDRFYRLYFSPGAERSGMEANFAERGFKAGRQMLKLAHELETRHGTFKKPLLIEDSKRPGYADLSIFNKRNFDHFKGVDSQLVFAQCLNIWPSFMNADVEGHKNVLGTPAIEHFDAAAELAAAYIADEISDSGRTANFWEVKNESDIDHEWTYHGANGYDSWELLAELHNLTAKAIKDIDSSIQVGGPASAWPRMEMGNPDFKLWDKHKRFMDLTKENLDFYSHHFYDSGVQSSFDARYDGYTDWLQGRLDCVLDMLCAEMRHTNNVKPILITEYGSLVGGTRDIDYWLRVCNYSSFMLQYMERPGDFAMTVPFLLGFMHWEPDSGYALVRNHKSQGYYLTKNAYLLDLWEGVSGSYLRLDSVHPNVHTLAWKKENKVYLAVNNQSGRTVHFKPKIKLEENNGIVAINYRHPSYFEGRFVMRRGTLPLNKLKLNIPNSETAIFIIQTDKSVPTQSVIKQRSYYAEQTAVLLSHDTRMEIELPENELNGVQTATLRIGIEDKYGPTGQLQARFNNHHININLDAYTGIENFFEYIDIIIPATEIRDKNEIHFNLPHSRTTISHAKLTTQSVGGSD